MIYNRLYEDNGFQPYTGYTQLLSEYLVNLKYEDLPSEVVLRAKYILLQTLGVSLAARGTEIAKKADALAVASNNGLGGSVTRWNETGKLSPANAALLAGTLADALDWEDCSWTGHPSAGIIPAAVIAAEERHKSGRELITAIVGAYEVYQRIANAAQPKDHSKGWGLTSWQIFGVVAAAARLYDLDAAQVDRAFGLAAEHSTIPACYHETTMSDFYHFEHGYRARDGILIAKEAEKGLHNQRSAFDDVKPSGYLSAITDEPKPEKLTEALGERYLIMETLLKHWPANMWVQSATEAVSEIIRKYGVAAVDVEEIIVDPGNGDRMWAPKEGFTSVTHAQFSTPFVIASLLTDNTPGAQWYAGERLKDPKILELAAKVKSSPSPLDYPGDGFAKFRIGQYPLKTVTVRTKTGKTYVEQVDRHPGHPYNMYTEQEISSRFRIQAAPVLSAARTEEALRVILHVEDTADAAALASYLQPET